jgi:DNA-binding transcriptional LysR family regulator
MLDLRRLRILRELRHRGTITAVAEALGYSASTISQQLRVLEAETGAALLERAGRRVRLTDSGITLARHADHAPTRGLRRQARGVDASRVKA